MTQARYTPQMLVATLCVLILPAGVVWIRHARRKLASFWLGIILGLALTFMVLTSSTAYWRRRKHPASVLFSELLVWVGSDISTSITRSAPRSTRSTS